MIKNIIFIFLCTSLNLYAFTYGNQVFIKDSNEIKNYQNKNIALVVNQNSLLGSIHLIDALIAKGLKIKKLFALEHGVRGTFSAGDQVDETIDQVTGLPIISLYGKKKAPSKKDLKDIDVIIYDIQDVGVRFYTYIASLGNIMQALDNTQIELIILDRPNPHNYVMGPVNEFNTFLAPYPIPIVYGLTIGELALMIQGEEWREVSKLNLRIIKMHNYKRSDEFQFAKMPSPNLRSLLAIKNYPTLALFEPINLSIGRGTYIPFTLVGAPEYTKKEILFTPISIKGMAEKPKFLNKKCYGEKVSLDQFDFKFFLSIFYREKLEIKYLAFFKQLVGSEKVVELIQNKANYRQIKAQWTDKLNKYIARREKYLLY